MKFSCPFGQNIHDLLRVTRIFLVGPLGFELCGVYCIFWHWPPGVSHQWRVGANDKNATNTGAHYPLGPSSLSGMKE